MKYIRTKYGNKIIDVSKLKYIGENETDYMFCKVYKNGKESKLVKCFTKKVILKVADTIEELCDCFIGKVGDEEYIHLIGLWERKNYPAIKEVYGAVWTGWGLRYVAKMNDRGELELL